MKKIKWGNVLVLILFAICIGSFLGDLVLMAMGYTLTMLGLATLLLNVFLIMATSVYIYEAGYEK